MNYYRDRAIYEQECAEEMIHMRDPARSVLSKIRSRKSVAESASRKGQEDGASLRSAAGSSSNTTLPRTGAYAPEATCKHGVHPYDCREGCDPQTMTR